MDCSDTSTDTPDYITIQWHIADVCEVRPDLTDKQCREVLRHSKDCHDATIGINWEVIRTVADDLFPQTGEATR
jgi:hypothetical protein